MSEQLPDQVLEAANHLSLEYLEGVAAVLQECDGTKSTLDIVQDSLPYQRDMYGAYEWLRMAAMTGWFEPGEFDPDKEDRRLLLSEQGEHFQTAVYDLLEAKTGRRTLT